MESVYHHKGVYPVNEEIRAWLEQVLYEPSVKAKAA
jgi:hypothetical protein